MSDIRNPTPDEMPLIALLEEAGWRLEESPSDKHSLRKGGPATYTVYIPPGYRKIEYGSPKPTGPPIAWTLKDALRRAGID